MFPHLRSLVQELFGNERSLQTFLADPDAFIRGMSVSAEEQGALLRLGERLASLAETGVMIVSPAGIWP